MKRRGMGRFALALLLCALLTATGCLAEAASYGENVRLDGTYPLITGDTDLEKMTIVLSGNPLSVVPPQEREQVKLLTEKTGLEFEWVVIPSAGAVEKVNLMLASGDLPDVFYNCISDAMVIQYMGQNVFMPTEALTDQYMPNLKKIYEQHPEYAAEATAPDGHRYGFPFIEEMRGLVLTQGPFMINTAWLEACGLEMPTTIDEWKDAMIAFKNAGDLNGNGIDDEVPIGTSFTSSGQFMFGSNNLFHYFVGAFGETDIANADSMDHLKVGDGNRILFTADTEAYKQCLKFFRDLQEEGLIEPDAFSAHPTGGAAAFYLDKLKGDDAVYGSFSCWAPWKEISNPDNWEQYEALPRLEGPAGKTGVKLNYSEMQFKAMGAITTACKYPELVALWCDYLNNPEVAITTNWGPEGMMYQRDEDGVLRFPLDEKGYYVAPEPWENFGEVVANTTLGYGPFVILNEYYDTVAEYTFDAVDLLAGQKTNGKDEILAEGTSLPLMMMTTEEQARIAQLQPTIKNIVSSYQMSFILDGDIDELWDQYVSELKAAGVEDLVAAFQSAYDRYVGNYNAVVNG